MLRPHRIGFVTYQQEVLDEDGVTVITPAGPKYDWFANVSEEGITGTFEALSSEIKTYLSGDAVYNKRVSGMNIVLSFSMYNFKKKTLAKMLPYCTYDEETDSLDFEVEIGYGFRENAVALVIRPFDKTDDSEDMLFYLANITNGLELVMHGVEDQAIPVEIECYPLLVQNAEGRVVVKYGTARPWIQDFIENKGHFFNPDDIIEG